jgi:MFS family permease
MRAVLKVWSRFFPNPGYYGWVVVGLGFLASALSSPGQSFVIALDLEPVMADLGMSRVAISSWYAIATLLAAACLPVLGGLADRVPGGRFLAAVLALLAAAMLGFAAARTVTALVVAFVFLRLLGQGAIALGTLTATVRWFRRYRGRALAVVGLGYAFGQMVFPALVPSAFMAYSLAGAGMAYATGVMLERIPSRVGVAISLGLSTVAFAAVGLALPPVAGALLYATLLGLGSGANAAANSIVWPDYFGIEALGAVKGVVNAVRNGATALGPSGAAAGTAAEGARAGGRPRDRSGRAA